MPTKITIIYNDPTDTEAFEAAYPSQVLLAKTLPGLQRIESAKVWPKEDGTATPAHRQMDLYFDNYDSASAAVATSEAGTLFSHTFELATGGVTVLFSDIEES